MNAPLVIFDVDGTLCDTCDVDDRAFCEVATRLVGTKIAASSWQSAPHITDAGIMDWLWREHRGRPPVPAEVDTFIREFEATLAEQLKSAPALFREVPGAGRLLRRLGAIGWRLALATGGWARTARLKLRAAGLPESALLASSDDSPDRLKIFSLALDRASTTRAERVVLVGDGVWDVRAALGLGWSFVGVGQGRQRDVLRRAGAVSVVPDLTDCEHVIELLRTSQVPGRPDRRPEAGAG